MKRTSPITAPTGSAPARSCKVSPMATSFCRPPCPTTWQQPNWILWMSRILRSRQPRPKSRSASKSSLRSRANAAPIRSIENSAKLCGMTAAWPAQMPDCARRSPESRNCAKSSGTTFVSSAAGEELNQALEKANRISDFLELAELMCIDALDRTESCGGHFRVESQTPEGEAKRDDANFSYTAAWEWKGLGQAPALHKEPLTFEYVPSRKGVTSSHESHAQNLAAAERKRTAGSSSPIR